MRRDREGIARQRERERERGRRYREGYIGETRGAIVKKNPRSLRRACILLTIYLCLIPQSHMLSKRMTAFRVLIVTYFDAIEEFMQPVNCYK